MEQLVPAHRPVLFRKYSVVASDLLVGPAQLKHLAPLTLAAPFLKEAIQLQLGVVTTPATLEAHLATSLVTSLAKRQPSQVARRAHSYQRASHSPVLSSLHCCYSGHLSCWHRPPAWALHSAFG